MTRINCEKIRFMVFWMDPLSSLLSKIHLCDLFCFFENFEVASNVDAITVYHVNEKKSQL